MKTEPSLTTDTDTVLMLRDLSIVYRSAASCIEAVRNVDFSIRRGEVVALVGESGSGKSTIAHAIMGMLPDAAEISAGSIVFQGVELAGMDEQALARIRGRKIGSVPQDPMVALNALHRVGRQVIEPLRIHRLAPSGELRVRAIELLTRVGLSRPEVNVDQFPHELSGGMRQRVLIAGALGPEPQLVIADEPTTALDVTVQRQILDDLARLTQSVGTSVLLITHDLAVAAERADRILVMRYGEIVEEGPALEIIDRPKAPYTRLLLEAAPSLSLGRRRYKSDDGVKAPASPIGLAAPANGPPLLSLKGVGKLFPQAQGAERTFRAVDDVSFSIARGETLGLVGESGSGKSTIARMVLGLTAPTSGIVRFDGADIGRLSRTGRRQFHRRAQLIYQNPYASLNPRLTILEIVAEPLDGFGIGERPARRRRALELLDQVGLSQAVANRRPAELSGGQRQRVAIARALAPRPDLIVCDEPVSALDVSIQAQILELLSKMQELYQLSYLFISHDLAVVRQVSDRVGVMKDSCLVELGEADEIFAAPRHSYTRLLLQSIPGTRLERAA